MHSNKEFVNLHKRILLKTSGIIFIIDRAIDDYIKFMDNIVDKNNDISFIIIHNHLNMEINKNRIHQVITNNPFYNKAKIIYFNASRNTVEKFGDMIFDLISE